MDLNYEKKLLDLLGYTLSGSDKNKEYKILDKEEVVGYIKYQKIQSRNKRKGEPAIYGLITNINSNQIVFNNIRKIYDNGFQMYTDKDIDFYELDIKRDNDIDRVELNLGESFNINIWSKKFGYSKLSIDCNGIHLFYSSKTDNYNIQEIVNYRLTNETLSHYEYQITYCDKHLKLTGDKGVTTREISGYQIDLNKLKIFEKTYINDKLRTKWETCVDGTIEEMVLKHEMGIDAFNHYRYLLGKILPFKYDIIDEVIHPELIDEYNLKLFIPITENKEKIYS